MNAKISEVWQKVSDYTKTYPIWWVHVVSGFLVGFFAGFILKMFGKPLLYAVLILTVANYFLYYFGIVEFHSDVFLQSIGLTELPTMQNVTSTTTAWIGDHIIACLSGIVGFLFGWRLG